MVLIVVVFFMGFLLKNPLKENLVIEAGSDFPDISHFLLNTNKNASFITEVSQINTSRIGNYLIEIKAGLLTYDTELVIEDTSHPILKVRDLEVWSDTELTLDDFIVEYSDNTEVTLSFKKEPKFEEVGTQEITIQAKDEGNNITSKILTLTIKKDTDPPVISGVKDQEIFEGDPLSYRRGVLVSDNKDSNVDLVIDNSQVNLSKPGDYKVIYKATDKAGNKTEVTSNIKVKRKGPILLPDEELYRRADNILTNILKDEMTVLEKLNAIYDYSRFNIRYIGKSNKTDWKIGASTALVTKAGDCYNYYALSKLLLERAGFEIRSVKRIPESRSRHYWVLVNYDNLWYHFDPTWNPTGYSYRGFMISESEAMAYTELVRSVRENYYVYDYDLYNDINIAINPMNENE